MWTSGFCRRGHARPSGALTCAVAECGAATSQNAAVAGTALPLNVAKDVPPESASEAVLSTR
eukprot:12612526-Heterocapsa_arctica.AAC.1